MKNQEVKYVAIGDITPYDRNPRLNERSIDKVAASIKSFGFRQPILVDKDMVIIAGHTRRLAAMKLGLEEVPVIVCDDLTEDQVKALRLADNKVGESSKWDTALLVDELKDLDDYIHDFSMEDFGFDLKRLMESLVDTKPEGYFTPTGKCPDPSECVDDVITRGLLARIDELDADDGVKDLLKAGAIRRTFFNFDKIAEFYGFQSPVVQKLMEDCDLVDVGKKKKRKANDPKLVNPV